MCGIVAFVRKPKGIQPADTHPLLDFLESIDATKKGLLSLDVNKATQMANRALSIGGSISLVINTELANEIQAISLKLREAVEELLVEDELVEGEKESLTLLNDAFWRIEQDACIAASQIRDLITTQKQKITEVQPRVIAIYRSINLVLRSLDRIEVRGRDSAGISISLSKVSLDQTMRELLEKRSTTNFMNSSVRVADGANHSTVYFVYKRAAEIGELGDNVKHLRASIASDDLFFDLISQNESCHEMVLAHTRWASMGVISEENTHPLDSLDATKSDAIVALGVLNGDIDNHTQLRSECEINHSITTDAKLIPVLYSHERQENGVLDPFDSCRKVVSRFEGSTAVGLIASDETDKLFLALRGGGQGLFIGLGEDEFFVASEPYGVVEVTDKYVRVDGETPRDPSQPITSRGQVFSLDQNLAGELDGLRRSSYDGQDIPLTQNDLIVSEVTTRDIDRGNFPHYLWKEINEAPRSFSTTIQGKFSIKEESFEVATPDEVFSKEIRENIASGRVQKILIVGQGTAAVAGQACAHFFDIFDTTLDVKATLATEISGFALKDNMSDTLVIAVSQSGTTTDTNRTVDLLKDRGASVIAIVNRRGSDLSTKAEGVCYTSSGRDVEMSVASTKAFYAQVAAGAYIAIAVGSLAGQISRDNQLAVQIIKGLTQIPEMMKQVLSQRDSIAEIAKRSVLSRRSWATVGNGSNSIAAREIRIKSSELCYKAIAMDSTEDKKHIDLSSEPLIVVCAAGMDGSNADDVAKEVAIYNAHKAKPIVITDDDSERFDGTDSVIVVPKVQKDISFILCTVAGHILGYESAKAIDGTALVLRQARGALAEITDEQLGSLNALRYLGDALSEPASAFFEALSAKNYDAVLDASDASNLTKLFVALTPPFTPELLNENCGGLQTPNALLNCAVSMLTQSIDQLTRPIDAIRHQAKTVTVGISRSDDTLLRSPSIAYVIDSGIERDLLQFPVIRTLLALDEMVEQISGHTRYKINGDVNSSESTISIVEQKGSAQALISRVSSNSILRGTKHLVAREQSVWIAKGKSDGRNVILIPEIKRSKTVGITLLHFDVKDNALIDTESRKRILEGYKQRLFALKDAVTETNDQFDENILETIDVMELLTEPVVLLAKNWIQ
jgi:glucosamine--fructose-6-phosphate aminotransferase (isomerizing)